MTAEPPKLDTSLHGVPSITQQTPWKCEFFDFGKAQFPGVDYFNCAITKIGDKKWLITRRSIHHKGQLFGMNDLVAFELRGMTPLRGFKIGMEKRFTGEQWEDPRVLVNDGRVWVSCCDFVWQKGKWTGAHQIISEVNERWHTTRRYDPVYGGNGANLGQNKTHEKNWLFFFQGETPHLIYKASPHEVVALNPDFSPIKMPDRWPMGYKTEWDSSVWKYGEIRGGTNPVLIGDEYYTFFHSSTPWMKPKRQYHMGCYTFESKPPFAVKRITVEPLLSGSHKDVWAKGKPLVVFPCGAIFEHNNFIVSLGVNDLVSAWIEIPKRDIDGLMVEV